MNSMYLIVWEYQVKSEYLPDFENIYAIDGAWAKLFNKSDGYLETELLRDETNTHRFLTIDRWISADAYNKFKIDWQTEYESLDAQCEDMTEQETLLGKYLFVI